MLWRFYKTDPDVCHYLFGTMHLATKEAYTYADIAKKHILQAAVYAGEMDLDDASKMNMMPYFMLEDGKKFKDFFRPKQYEKTRKIILKIFNIDIIHYDQCSPFFISNLLAESSLDRSLEVALDHHLWQFAMDHQKEMVGVESVADQIRILQEIPLDYQIKAFKDVIKNISSFRQKTARLNKNYAKGNLEKIYKTSKKSMGKIRKLMIYERNAVMKDRILDLSSDKRCFFAIGAAHFPGDKGILALLKKDGYKIKKMT